MTESTESPQRSVSLLEFLDPLSTLRIPLLSKRSTPRRNISGLSARKALHKLDVQLSEALDTTTFEKLFYPSTLFSIFVSGWLLAAYPQYFHVYYTFLFVLLMPIRFYTYWKKKYHYFLADLCYFVNFLCLLFIWVFPDNEQLYQSCFAFTMGTLAWAVITWRNSLVIHSIEKITSCFIHIFPPLTFHVITHELDDGYRGMRFPGAGATTQWKLSTGILYTSLLYLVWQSLYHVFITIRQSSKISSGERATSFEWLRRSHAATPVGRFVNSLPEPFPVVAFTLIQYAYQLSTMTLCSVWWRWKLASSCWMVAVFVIAGWNGAGWYLEFLRGRLTKEIHNLKGVVENLEEELTSARELLREHGLDVEGGVSHSGSSVSVVSLEEKKDV